MRSKLLFFSAFLLLSAQGISAQEIIHYWHFNDADGELGTVTADLSNTAPAGTLVYQKIDEEGDNIGIMDDVSGTEINARLGFGDGRGIRPRNPSANGELHIAMSTEGYENILLSYATERSGQGMLTQQVWYTTDGENYQTLGNPVPIDTDYVLVQFDLTDIAAANDNPLFAVKIRFIGQNTGDSGNNRIDNLVLEGSSASDINIVHYWHFNQVSGEVTTVEADFFNGDEPSSITYQKIDPNGDEIGIMDDVSGSAVNSRLGFEAGNGIRPRNPSENAELVITLNSSGFANLKLSYATERSGQGMLEQQLYITTDGENWEAFGDPVEITTDYSLVEFDFSGTEAAENNENFAAKIQFLGQNTGGSGNNRIDNVVLEGISLGGAAEGVEILGGDVTMNLGETLQLTAAVSPPTATNQNVMWSSADENIATVSGSGLVLATGGGTTAVTATTEDGGFEASVNVTVTTPVSAEFIVSDSEGPLPGATVTLDGDILVTVADGSVSFERLPGTYTYAVSSEGYIGVSGEIELTEDLTTEVTLSNLPGSLVYYWHFNDLPEGEVTEVPADHSEISGTVPSIVYGFLPEYEEDPELTVGFMDDYGTGSELNLQMDEPAGIALRVRNRSEGRTLVIPAPTPGYENIVLAYDVQRSGSGMLINHAEYTLNGTDWSDEGITPTQATIDTDYETKFFDFTEVTGAADNPQFTVRITFEGNTDQGNGNNRYDNVTVFGDMLLSNENAEVKYSGMKIFPNPSPGAVTISLTSRHPDPVSDYRIFDMAGRTVKAGQMNGDLSTVDLSALEAGTYILLLTNGDVTMQEVIVRSR